MVDMEESKNKSLESDTPFVYGDDTKTQDEPPSETNKSLEIAPLKLTSF